MLNQIVGFSKKFISLRSTKDNPLALKKVLETALNEVKEFTIERFEKDGFPSALIYKEKTRPRRFKIILNAHLDVVAGKKEQFKPYEKDGKLYGRGAIDMKAAAAVEILVFAKLARKLNYPIALQLVTDEEIGGFKGTKYQIEKGVRGDFVLAGEPTDFGINNKAKGIIWLKIKTKGKSAHSAYPWQGENAIWEMNEVLNQIRKIYPPPKKEVWNTTINVTKIETSNQTFNKVPEDCIISLDIRYLPEDKEAVIKKLQKDLSLPKDSFEIILNEPPQFTDQKNPYVAKLKQAVEKITYQKAKTIVKHGGSDIRHFNLVGCPGVTFGPVGKNLHADGEWVDIKGLKDYYQILKTFLLSV